MPTHYKNIEALIHKMAMTSFAITLHGQRCRRHLVGQQVSITRPSVLVRSC